ncbi:hypothetical protein GQR58_025272 [Nymphon striatum]|nr:hypothetical protein GQR58_025272 [Nymphon striatum]
MFRKALLVSIFMVLSYGFWLSPDLKQIAAGVALFLFGMLALEEGFKAFTGGVLERILRKTTNKLWKSLSFGIVTTTLMQSSSLVSVISISFLSAGLISLASGIGIVFGANLGTTTGAWLVAGLGLKVKISAYAMPMLVFGVILVLQRQKELKSVGYIIAGIGFLFLGIHYMKEGFEVFRADIDLRAYAVAGYTGLFFQQITYENALALAIGSNVGTTITAILGSISANVNGKRLAGAHLVFNVVTGVIAIVMLYELIDIVHWTAQYLGIASDNYTLKLAIFHTLFNLIGVIVMLPFIGKLVNVLNRLLPEKSRKVAEPEYLSKSSIEIPEVALEAVRKETLNLYQYFFGIICHGLSFRVRDIHSEMPIKQIIESHKKPIPVNIKEEYTNTIKGLYAEIVVFIGLAQDHMSSSQNDEVYELRSAGRNMLESIKHTQHLHKNLSHYLNDPNPFIREEYEKIRYRLGSILRSLSEIEKDEDDERTILPTLEAIRIAIQQADHNFSIDIDNLIREKHITGVMATSLMNDNSYTNNIATNLLEISTILFKSRNSAVHEVEQSLMLDEKETAEALADEYLSADNRKRKSKIKCLKHVLDKLRKKEKKLEKKFEEGKRNKEKISNELALIHAHRKKGLAMLKQLKKEREEAKKLKKEQKLAKN